MKKTLAAILAFIILTASFSSCGNKDTEAEQDTEAVTEADEKYVSEKIYGDTLHAYYELLYGKDVYPPCPENMDGELWGELNTTTVNWWSKEAGYCFYDINRDGREELILLDADYRLNAVLTHLGGKVKFVMRFDKTGIEGVIGEDGTIYNSGCGRFLSWYESTQTLSKIGELRHVSYYGYRNNTGNEGDGEYFKKTAEGQYITVTKDEVEELRGQSGLFEEYPDTRAWIDLMKGYLSYTPISDIKKTEESDGTQDNSEGLPETATSWYDISTAYRCNTATLDSPCAYGVHENPIWAAHDKDGRVILRVNPWDEYFNLPTVYGTVRYEFMSFDSQSYCAAMTSEDSAIFVAGRLGGVDSLEVNHIKRGSDKIEISHIKLPENTYVWDMFLSFTDSLHGALFLLEEYPYTYSAKGTEGLLLYKTSDGGRTWTRTNSYAPMTIGMESSVIFARFMSENVGIFSGRYYIFEYLEDRTYLTFDGGKTWQTLSPLPYPEYDKGIYTEIYNFEYSEGIYTATVHVVIDGGGTERREEIHKYTTTDLEAWELSDIRKIELEIDKNTNVISIFEETFSAEREVYLQNGSSTVLGKCAAFDKYLAYAAPKRSYIDFDGDKTYEVLITTESGGDFILHYDESQDRVYAYYFTPDNRFIYYPNGEFCRDYDKNTAYKVKAFDRGSIELETAEPTPNRGKVYFISFEIDFDTYAKG